MAKRPSTTARNLDGTGRVGRMVHLHFGYEILFKQCSFVELSRKDKQHWSHVSSSTSSPPELSGLSVGCKLDLSEDISAPRSEIWLVRLSPSWPLRVSRPRPRSSTDTSSSIYCSLSLVMVRPGGQSRCAGWPAPAFVHSFCPSRVRPEESSIVGFPGYRHLILQLGTAQCPSKLPLCAPIVVKASVLLCPLAEETILED